MPLHKNTITIRFLNLKTIDGHDEFNYEKPFSNKTYDFYVDPKFRKQLDIGTVVKIKNNITHDFDPAVIMDNQTVYQAQSKHKTIDGSFNRHLRGYLRQYHHDETYERNAYHWFRILARDARRRVAIAQQQDHRS